MEHYEYGEDKELDSIRTDRNITSVLRGKKKRKERRSFDFARKFRRF